MVCLCELGPSLRRRSALTWRTTPITGRFRVCPGAGAGHSSISLHTVDTGGRVRSYGGYGQDGEQSGGSQQPLTCFQAGGRLVEVLRGDQAQERLEQPDKGQAGHQHQRLQSPQGR